MTNRMVSTIYDDIATRVPINTNAAQDGAIIRPDGFSSISEPSDIIYPDPPMVVEVPPHKRGTDGDFTGRQVGHSQVYGYLGKWGCEKDSRAHKWCLRCVCGNYFRVTARTLKRVLAGKSRADRCPECDKLREMRDGRCK